LYFENVLPFNFGEPLIRYKGLLPDSLNPDDVPYGDSGWDMNVLRSLLGTQELVDEYVSHASLSIALFFLTASSLIKERSGEFADNSHIEYMKRVKADHGIDLVEIILALKDAQTDLSDAATAVAKQMKRISKAAGYQSAPKWTTDSDLILESTESEGTDSRYIISLRGLDLVDVSSVGWDTVLELRKDKNAMADLRKLRLFFTENFESEDPNYIADKLSAMHDKHKETAKIWGMRIAQRSVSVMLKQETLLAGAIASAPLALLGGPIAALGGLIVPVGRAALEFWQVKIDADEQRLDRPLEYLTRIERLQGK
jgi:hypothetical protein